MRRPTNLRNLPRTLLLLIAAWPLGVESHLDWPYNLPRHLKYFPEDEAHAKRQLDIERRMAVEPPVAVKKMPLDEGEKFYLEYWQFKTQSEGLGAATHSVDSWKSWERRSTEEELFANASMTAQFDAPVRVVDSSSAAESYFLRVAIRNLLGKRDYQCPSGTESCSSIGRPNSCCSTSSNCIIIEDTGLGDVGCCPKGQTCGGSVSGCDESAGYTSCPNSSNGGCCIPNYSCQDVGCVFQSTQTTIVIPSRTSTPSPSTPPPSSSAPAATTQPPSSTSPLTCSAGYLSCPVSLGGGCCPSGRTCASGIFCSGSDTPSSTTPSSTLSTTASTRSSGGALPPVRPTSDSPTTASPSSNDPSVCPTGFYMCSAYYRGGCCRVGRDCDSTSCPTSPGTTVIESNGVTVVAPTGASVASVGERRCATGWYGCPQSLGGECCPSGYACGTAVCSATVSAGGTVGKEEPQAVTSFGVQDRRVGMGIAWAWGVLGLVSGIVMVVL